MDDDAIKRLREFAELALKADGELLALVGTRAEAWQWEEANRRRTVAFAEVWRALDYGPRGVLALLDEREALKERLSDTRAKEQRALREAMEAVRERDAAMALLLEIRDHDDTAITKDQRQRIDALLGDGVEQT
ncbi:MAG: hypothetical protein ACK5XA_08655 [Tagaea sp.]